MPVLAQTDPGLRRRQRADDPGAAEKREGPEGHGRHRAYSVGYSNDSFSKKDLNNWINYLVTPLGTVRRYTPSTGEDIIIFDDVPFDPNHPER